MILLTGLYLDANAGRLQEFLSCIDRNTRNRSITAVHVFVEHQVDPLQLVSQCPQLASPKVELIVTGTRMTYRSLFVYANQELAGKDVIIANADIFFDHTLARLKEYELSGCLICLSRWDALPDGSWQLFDFEHSQDAWMFRSPIPEFPSDFYLGLPGCDNRLAWEAERAGLTLSNPSRTVRACHLHLTGVRRYSSEQRLKGPVRGVRPQLLESSAIRRSQATVTMQRQIPCAAVAFRETMGYTIHLLTLGASSHNNEVRPFTTIPAPLAGRMFTQVVSCCVSPVDVEFLSSGRLYLLVGTDWHGYYCVTAWLGQTAEPEPMPLVETRERPAFEVWSFVAEAGERFVSPTQVMLVSDYLERR